MAWTATNIPDLTGKTAVVTGGNGGLGLETVRELARKGAHVVIGARNLEKAAAAESDVKTEIPTAAIEVRKLDLSSLASVKEFADSVLADHPVIDLLFNNAGVMATPEWETEDGFEMQFGTNHLGHFALTAHLMPALLAADGARIVSTSSTARFAAGAYDLNNAHHRGVYDSWRAYGYSKLANLQFILELNKRLSAAGAKVKAYAADPGFSKTDLQATSTKNTGGHPRSRFFEKAGAGGRSVIGPWGPSAVESRDRSRRRGRHVLPSEVDLCGRSGGWQGRSEAEEARRPGEAVGDLRRGHRHRVRCCEDGRRGGCVTTTRVDRAALVRRALVELVAELGFRGTSMAAVAERAGVATGTAYVHYPSKDALVMAAYQEVKRALGEAVSAIHLPTEPAERFRALWFGVYRHLAGDPVRARFLVQVDSSPWRDWRTMQQ